MSTKEKIAKIWLWFSYLALFGVSGYWAFFQTLPRHEPNIVAAILMGVAIFFLIFLTIELYIVGVIFNGFFALCAVAMFLEGVALGEEAKIIQGLIILVASTIQFIPFKILSD